MNLFRNFKIARLILIITSASVFGVFNLRADQTNLFDSGFIQARGAETNGIYGMILVDQSRQQTIYVDICFATATNNNPSFFAYTNSQKPLGPGGHGFKYYMATNSFCGPIELRDAAGRLVPLLKPDVDSLKSYPASYDIWLVSRILETGKNGFYSGPAQPQPVALSHTPLSSFDLKDYFKLEKSGEYRLTVWPKIYEWVSPKSRICRRIDIPPVTVTINWKGDPQK